MTQSASWFRALSVCIHHRFDSTCVCLPFLCVSATVSAGNPGVITHTGQWQELLRCPAQIHHPWLRRRRWQLPLFQEQPHQTVQLPPANPLSSPPWPCAAVCVCVCVCVPAWTQRGRGATRPAAGDKVKSVWRIASHERLEGKCRCVRWTAEVCVVHVRVSVIISIIKSMKTINHFHRKGTCIPPWQPV